MGLLWESPCQGICLPSTFLGSSRSLGYSNVNFSLLSLVQHCFHTADLLLDTCWIVSLCRFANAFAQSEEGRVDSGWTGGVPPAVVAGGRVLPWLALLSACPLLRWSV